MSKRSCAWILFLFFFFHSAFSFSQEITPISYGKITPKDFTLPKSSLIDSSTRAVVLAAMGEIGFVGNQESNWLSYVFHQKMRIMILKGQAYDLATERCCYEVEAPAPISWIAFRRQPIPWKTARSKKIN